MTTATLAVDPADPTRLLVRAPGSPPLRVVCAQGPGQPLVRITPCAPQGMGHQVAGEAQPHGGTHVGQANLGKAESHPQTSA
jgi:hypothetical protein